ncbi:glutamine synthetase/guanido kinase [Penicillium cosmopolitanum]|uniref:Glutamine synthetase/guanido kinase n=1 Tax=Penicillium cosmopolitanum TaxID=1131564 RepID=A0A9W9VNN7_9EURO|nr:glutamine synthetase/guanido kinase [Penicillium cosmopolitanum]KAJ5386410.1 glutamine synthetase/guanido kinase [Penicillium cosmopolitanum]
MKSEINHSKDWANCNGSSRNLAEILKNDTRVQLAGIDCDGQLRGKVMSKEKFLSIVDSGFGMSSAIFGWDMHDMLFDENNTIASSEQGYADFTSVVDQLSMRRLPWAQNMPFFLLRFTANDRAVSACGRSMIKIFSEALAVAGCRGVAGVELEFFNYQTPSEDGYHDQNPSKRKNLAAFLRNHQPSELRPLTDGMFGYSITRPMASSDFFFDVIDTCARLDCQIESWHTESGPGVFEGALRFCEMEEMADRVSLFKYITRCLGNLHGVTPCFLAKPVSGLPGNSGHIHISLTDLKGRNLFSRDAADPNSPWSDLANVSDLGRHFLAGLLNALPDLMPLLAPTINSYKRLVENYWAPVHLSWGLEDRRASVRLIAPPVCKPSATRFEIRVPGADIHPHYALTALISAGWKGVERNSELTIPPLSAHDPGNSTLQYLPNSLEKAVENFKSPNSVARDILGSEFVDLFTLSREHELRLYREAVTDWEFKRYIEIV